MHRLRKTRTPPISTPSHAKTECKVMPKHRRTNRVYPDAPGIWWTYFLVEVYSPGSGHVGCYIIDQAHVGPLTNKTEERLWNQVSAQLERNARETGLGYRIMAVGSRGWCIKSARDKGWKDV